MVLMANGLAWPRTGLCRHKCIPKSGLYASPERVAAGCAYKTPKHLLLNSQNFLPQGCPECYECNSPQLIFPHFNSPLKLYVNILPPTTLQQSVP